MTALASSSFANPPPEKFAKLRSVSREIIGIKLEPIVALSSSRIVGMEVLSLLASPQQSEQFFQHQSPNQTLTLLETQLAALKNTAYNDNLFINLPITVFVETESFARILPLLGVGHNIEIVEPHSFFLLPAESRACVTQRLQILSERGCRIWLDDVNDSVIRAFLPCRLPLSGIKIDKLVFWRKRATPALAQLVRRCEQVASHVLIEGIESQWDRECALQAGAGFGQGYYWPSVGWSEQ